MPAERVVFVHGAGGSGIAAWPQQHGLAADYDCLFLRLPGLDPDKDIAIVRDALGDGGHLVAHDTGAVPAMLAALRYPGTVRSLVLCEPAVFSLTRDLPATAAHLARRQPLPDGAAQGPLDIVPGVPTLVLTGGWEPLYEEVAGFLVSTGAEHRQIGGNHRPQDTAAGRQGIRDFLARNRRAEKSLP